MFEQDRARGDPDGEVRKLTSKDLVRGVPKGTLYVQHAGGGGGYGDPRLRPREKVREEVRNGVISPAVALSRPTGGRRARLRRKD